MAKTITLRFAAKCKDCGTDLPVGVKARWYGRGRIYGIGCHEKGDGAKAGGARVLVSSRCEDYPCCGHGPTSTGGDGGGCPKVYETPTGETAEVWACAGCGAELPQDSRSSLCGRCLTRDDNRDEAFA